MALEIRMPQISSDMTEADVVGWLAAPGDTISEGDLLYEIETDKSTVEIEAPASGVLREILIPAGSTGIAVGTVLATFDPDASGTRTDRAAEDADSAPSARAGTDSPRTTAESQADPAPADATKPGDESPPPGDPIAATALARRVAEQAGLDLSSVTGSGSRGRITRGDVEQRIAGGTSEGESARRATHAAAASSPAPTLPGRDPSLAGASGSTIQPASLTKRCRVDAAIAVLDRLNANTSGGPSIVLLDLVVRAAALALRENPELNVSWRNATLTRHEGVSIAVSTGDGRTGVPHVIRDAALKGLSALGAERRSWNEEADRSGAEGADEAAAALVVHDIGTSGLDGVQLAAPSSHGGALGVGAVRAEPVVEGGLLAAGTMLTLTLSPNPRIDDPAAAIRFLRDIAQRLERPLEMIV